MEEKNKMEKNLKTIDELLSENKKVHVFSKYREYAKDGPLNLFFLFNHDVIRPIYCDKYVLAPNIKDPKGSEYEISDIFNKFARELIQNLSQNLSIEEMSMSDFSINNSRHHIEKGHFLLYRIIGEMNYDLFYTNIKTQFNLPLETLNFIHKNKPSHNEYVFPIYESIELKIIPYSVNELKKLVCPKKLSEISVFNYETRKI